VVKWTRLSCHDFAHNQVRLQRFALAHNLGNFLRRLALPAGVKHWSLTTLRDKLIKIAAKVVHHARSVLFQMAEVAVPRKLFRLILELIRRRTNSAAPPRWAARRQNRGDFGGCESKTILCRTPKPGIVIAIAARRSCGVSQMGNPG